MSATRKNPMEFVVALSPSDTDLNDTAVGFALYPFIFGQKYIVFLVKLFK